MRRVCILFAFLCIVSSAMAFDFATVCGSGQTLYFKITDSVNSRVSVTFPGPTIDSAYLNVDQPVGDLVIPSQVMFNGHTYTVTGITSHAFAKCMGLDSLLEIPSTITEIGSYAFLHCANIKKLQFNAVDCTRAFAAFEGCWFESIIFGEGVTTIPDAAFANSAFIDTISFPSSVTTIGKRAFFNCPNLRGANISTVDTVDDFAFSDCPALKLLSPLNAIVIGKCAFCGDTSLTELTFLDGVSVIEDQAFFYCPSINTLRLGVNVGVVGEWAFNLCSAIDTVFCEAIVPPAIQGIAFANSINDCVLVVPCSSLDQYSQANGWSDFGMIIPDEQFRLTVIPNDYNAGFVTSSDTLFCMNESALIEAIPYRGYIFKNWNDGETSNPRVLMMQSDTLLVAQFTADSTLSVDEGVCGSDVKIFTVGHTIRLEASCPTGFQILDIVGRCYYRSIVTEENVVSCLMPGKGVYLVVLDNGQVRKTVVR